MFHELQSSLALWILVLMQLPAAVAQAQTVPHKEHCIGVITGITSTSIDYTGSGVATQFGKYTIVGGHDFDADGNIFDGEFVATASDGSTIHGTYTGTVTLLSDGSARSEMHVHWLGGTGRFTGVTGEGDVVCFHGTAVGEEIEYVTAGTLTRS